jgi:hypothetical protein
MSQDKLEYCQKNEWKATGEFNLEQDDLKTCYIDTFKKAVGAILTDEQPCDFSNFINYGYSVGKAGRIYGSNKIEFEYNSDQFAFSIEAKYNSLDWDDKYTTASNYLLHGIYDCFVKLRNATTCVDPEMFVDCTNLCVYNQPIPTEVENYPHNDCSNNFNLPAWAVGAIAAGSLGFIGAIIGGYLYYKHTHNFPYTGIAGGEA